MPFKIGRFRTQFELRDAALSSSRSFWPEEGNCKQIRCTTPVRRGSPATNSAELPNDTTVEVFDDVLHSGINPAGGDISSSVSEPIREIDWQAHGNALGEHIAGHNCKDPQGYNGHHMSAEEMRTCNTVQCLIEKARQMRDWLPEWALELEDEDFERESKYFLSGLGDRIGSWEDEGFCSPRRHNVGELDLALGNRRGFTSGDIPP